MDFEGDDWIWTVVAPGKIDGIFIGFNWVLHPDLVKRLLHRKPLHNVPDIAHLQTVNESGDWSIGYTDYPTAVYWILVRIERALVSILCKSVFQGQTGNLIALSSSAVPKA